MPRSTPISEAAFLAFCIKVGHCIPQQETLRGVPLAYPDLYDVSYSYTGFQEAQGDDSFPGTQLDSDLAGLETSVGNIALFIRGVMRSDGALQNGIVTYDSLSASLQTAGLQAAVPWATATAYPVNFNATQSSNLYRSLVAHTSGVFATDLAAGKWVLVTALAAGTNGTNGTNGTDGAGYGGASATSLLIANSVTKVFATQAGLAYQVGNYVRASSAANGANFMEGLVSAYSGTSLSIAVAAVGGAGTFADWHFGTSGTPGTVGVATIDTISGAVTISGLLTRSSQDLRVTAATQSDQETGTSVAAVVTSGRQHFHPSALKAFVRINANTGTPTISRSYNVSSLTDSGVGDIVINWTTAFSDAVYVPVCWGDLSATAQGTGRWIQYTATTTTQFRILTTTVTAATGEDWDIVCVLVGGDF